MRRTIAILAVAFTGCAQPELSVRPQSEPTPVVETAQQPRPAPDTARTAAAPEKAQASNPGLPKPGNNTAEPERAPGWRTTEILAALASLVLLAWSLIRLLGYPAKK